MAKEDKIQAEGEVIDALPNAMFKVRLDMPNQPEILAQLSGKMRMHYIKIVPGDRVRVGATVVLARSPRAHRPCTVFRDRTSPEAYAVVREQRHRGALFVVEAGGTIHVGDVIERIAG